MSRSRRPDVRVVARVRLSPHQWSTLRALLSGTAGTTEDAQVERMCSTVIRQIDAQPVIDEEVADEFQLLCALVGDGPPIDGMNECGYCHIGLPHDQENDPTEHVQSCVWARAQRSILGLPLDDGVAE